MTTEIRRIDEKLAILRESWMDAAETKKALWLERINKELDARLIEMKKIEK